MLNAVDWYSSERGAPQNVGLLSILLIKTSKTLIHFSNFGVILIQFKF